MFFVFVKNLNQIFICYQPAQKYFFELYFSANILALNLGKVKFSFIHNMFLL